MYAILLVPPKVVFRYMFDKAIRKYEAGFSKG